MVVNPLVTEVLEEPVQVGIDAIPVVKSVEVKIGVPSHSAEYHTGNQGGPDSLIFGLMILGFPLISESDSF